jgi:hypothetical protein
LKFGVVVISSIFKELSSELQGEYDTDHFILRQHLFLLVCYFFKHFDISTHKKKGSQAQKQPKKTFLKK